MHGRENCSRIPVLIQTPLASGPLLTLTYRVSSMAMQHAHSVSSPRKDFPYLSPAGNAPPVPRLGRCRPRSQPSPSLGTGCAAVDLGHYAPCPQTLSLPPCSSNSAHRTRWLDPGPEGESDTGAFSPERAASIMQGGRPPGATRAK